MSKLALDVAVWGMASNEAALACVYWAGNVQSAEIDSAAISFVIPPVSQEQNF